MKINLNLLSIIVALAEEGTVSAAARRLKMRQSSVSRALAQLRAAFGDPLFVRTARGMSPTPRTLKLLERIRAALGIVIDRVLHVTAFDPAISDRNMTIALSDVGEMARLPGILDRLSKEAPTGAESELDLSGPPC
jgi:DNA-binding transcriptional LysR family regulator